MPEQKMLSQAEATDSYEYPKTNPDPYEHARGKGGLIPQEMTKLFSKKMKMAILRSALPTQKPKTCVCSFIRKIQRRTPFRFNISGEQEIEDADIIFANHQGPRVDDEPDAKQIKSSATTPKGLGGTEGPFGLAVLPEGIQFVLKEFLVRRYEPLLKIVTSLRPKNWKSFYPALSDLVKAQAFLKTRPITVDRTQEKPSSYTGESRRWSTEGEELTLWEKYIIRLREERNRVADVIFPAAAENRETFIVYPEGTRSPDGRILGFVSEFFERILTNYILPQMKSGGSIRIGFLIADTLQAFPNGVGKAVPAYDKPITMKGIRYDPATMIAALRKRGIEKKESLSPEEMTYFGRMLLIDIHKKMSLALEEILAGTAEMQLA